MKVWYIHKMAFVQPYKRKEILPLVTTGMNLKGGVLNEISQSQKGNDSIYMWYLKELTSQKQSVK